jgi:hypothetical protein
MARHPYESSPEQERAVTDTNFQSWQEAFAAKLAEQNVNIDPAYAPREPGEATSYWLEGDGSHLAGSALEAYVESWGWETLKPLLEWAISATEFDPSAEGQASEGEEQIDVYHTWVFDLLVAATINGFDPYKAPPGDQIVPLIESGLSDASSVWPELYEFLDNDQVRAEYAQSLKEALDKVGPPPAV